METTLRIFRDRAEGGRLLADKLTEYANRPDVIVLALLRGGVPVGVEIARRLNVPLDVLTVRKLGVLGQPELAMGAIASGGIRVLNEELLSYIRIPSEEIEAVTKLEQKEMERRERVYRGDRPAPNVWGRTVILVDDGMATGATMRSAVEALQQRQPVRIIIAVPVASASTSGRRFMKEKMKILIGYDGTQGADDRTSPAGMWRTPRFWVLPPEYCSQRPMSGNRIYSSSVHTATLDWVDSSSVAFHKVW